VRSIKFIKRLLLGKGFVVVEHEALGALTMKICSSDEYIISQERRIVNLHAEINRLRNSLGIVAMPVTQKERDEIKKHI